MYFSVEFGPVKGERPEKESKHTWEQTGSGQVHQLYAHPADFGRCGVTNQIKSIFQIVTKRKKAYKTVVRVSRIFQAPFGDWKLRNFGNTTLSSFSVIETSNFLLWKVGVATGFGFFFFFWSKKGLFLSLGGCCHLMSLSGTAASPLALNSSVELKLKSQRFLFLP